MKEQWKVIIMIILLILVVIFALNNTSNVAVNLLFAKFSVPLVLVILFSLLVGVIVGLVTSMAAIQANRKDNSALTKEISKLKEEHESKIFDKDEQIRQLKSDLEVNHHTATIVEPVAPFAGSNNSTPTFDGNQETPAENPVLTDLLNEEKSEK